MLDGGGNIYFLAKIFATDGLATLQAVEHDDRHDIEDYAAMMLAGGRSPEGWRSMQGRQLTWPASPPGVDHQPRTGHRGGDRSRQDRRGLLAAPVRRVRVDEEVDRRQNARTWSSWSTTTTRPRSPWSDPDVRPRLRREFPPADEGFGPRPVPAVQGHPDLAGTSRSR